MAALARPAVERAGPPTAFRTADPRAARVVLALVIEIRPGLGDAYCTQLGQTREGGLEFDGREEPQVGIGDSVQERGACFAEPLGRAMKNAAETAGRRPEVFRRVI